MARLTFTASFGLRRTVRRLLDREGFDYIEDRGFLDSQFVVDGAEQRVDQLHRHLLAYKEAQRASED